MINIAFEIPIHTFILIPFTPTILAIIFFILFLSIGIIISKNKPLWTTSIAVIAFGLMVYLLYSWIWNYSVLYKYNQPNSSVAQFNLLSSSHDVRVLARLSLIASNQNTPPEVLIKLYNKALKLDRNLRNEIFAGLAENSHTPSLILQKILETKDISVYEKNILTSLISSNPNLSLRETNEVLGLDNCEIRRQIVTRSDMTPQKLAEIIKNDPDLSVRNSAQIQLNFLQGQPFHSAIIESDSTLFHDYELKVKESTDPNQLKQIYNEIDKHPDFYALFQNLAMNCSLSADLFYQIFNRTKTLNEYYRKNIIENLAKNLGAPVDLLKQLAEMNNTEILEVLAKNPNVSKEFMTKMTQFPDCIARKNLILNPNLPEDILKQLTSDKDESVRMLAKDRLKQATISEISAWENFLSDYPSCNNLVKPILNEKYKNWQKGN